MLEAVVIPDRAERERLGFLHQGEARGVIAGAFEFLVGCVGFEHRDAERPKQVARADDPRGDAVDAGVEEIQPDMCAAKIIAAHEFLPDRLQLVVQDNHVVAVPAHAPADMQENLRHEAQHGGNLVRQAFRGVIMPGIKADEFLMFHRVAEVELVHADRIAFRADTEELAFNRIAVVLRIEPLLEDGVERFGEPLTRSAPVGGGVFHAVGNPDVGDGRRTQRLAHCRADLTAGLTMLNPKLTDAFVLMRQRKAAGGFGMRKACGIEVQADTEGPGPCDPVAEMARLNFIAIHFLTAELAVTRVQIEPVRAGNERECFRRVGAQLIRRAGFAGIIPRGHDAAGERPIEILKAAHVITLPAVQRDRDFGKRLEDFFGVHAVGGIAFPGEPVGLLRILFRVHCVSGLLPGVAQSKLVDFTNTQVSTTSFAGRFWYRRTVTASPGRKRPVAWARLITSGNGMENI